MKKSYKNNNQVVRIVEAETFNSRLDRLFSYFDKLPTFIEKGKYNNKDPRNNVQAIITRPEGNYFVKEWYFGHNIVTIDGNTYYAKKAAGATPATNENFLTGRFQLSNPTTQNPPLNTHTWDNFDSAVAGNNAAGTGAAIATSIKTYFTGYPLQGTDADADNTGDGATVTAYSAQWTTTDFNATGIKNGAIHDNASPVNATKLLTHFAITSFDKTASDTLKMFVNHTFLGQ